MSVQVYSALLAILCAQVTLTTRLKAQESQPPQPQAVNSEVDRAASSEETRAVNSEETRATVLDAAGIIQAMDRDGDGRLSLDEFPERAQPRVADAMRRLGVNSLGAVELARMLAGELPAASGAPKPSTDRLGSALKALDKNRDGKLTDDEIPVSMRASLKAALRRSGKSSYLELTAADLQVPSGSSRNPASGQSGATDSTRTAAGDPARRESAASPNGNRELPRTRADGDLDPRSFRGAPRVGRNEPFSDGGRRGAGSGGRSGRGGTGSRFGGGSRPGAVAGGLLQRVDVDRDGRISRAELSRLMTQFDAVDADGNGYLDGAELFGETDGLASPERPGRPGGLSQNGSGRPDRPQRPGGSDEVADADVSPTRSPNAGQTRPLFFKNLDQDDDGVVTRQEADARKLPKAFFDQFDSDGNGQLTLEEISAFGRQR